jgi:hypothetical protein
LGPNGFRLDYAGGAAASAVNPVVFAVILLAGLFILILPRKKIVIPLLLAGMLIPMNQVLVLGGLHFPTIRVLLLFGFVRMAWAKFSGTDKVFGGGMNKIDWALIVLTVFTAIDGVLLWQSSAELVFQLGNMFSAFGLYFLVRYGIQDEEDVRRALKVMVWVVAIVAPTMIYEHYTGSNPYFGLLGGLHAARLSHTMARDGFFRAQGPFEHPIIAGTFGGFMVPLFVAWWKRHKDARKYAVTGTLCATIISLTVGSSTALFALLAGIGALCLWPIRKMMRLVRWGIVAALVGLQMVMTAPVYHIITRISLSNGSDSYHRYALINESVTHFWDWVLVGTKYYGTWGWDMWDLANQYVGTADTAGLIPLIAFVAIIVYAFKYVGRTRKFYEGDKEKEFFVWAIGCSVFANAVGFFGISYWDQVIVAWYMILAIVAVVTLPARLPKAAPAPVRQTAVPSGRAQRLGSPARTGFELEKRIGGGQPAGSRVLR